MGNIIQASDLTVEQIQNGIVIYDPDTKDYANNVIELQVIGKDQDGSNTITVQTKTLVGDGASGKGTAIGDRRYDPTRNILNSELQNWLDTTFYNHLGSDFRSKIIPVTKSITPYQDGDIDSQQCKLFNLSIAEINGGSYSSYSPEQGAFPYQYYEIYSSTKRVHSGGSYSNWWLRSPYINDDDQTDYQNHVWYVASDGGIGHRSVNRTDTGTAPACVLSSDIYLEEDNNGKYKIYFNEPPTHDDEYLDYDGVVEIANRTERKFRFSEMPTPSADWLGKSIQYIGTTTVTEPIYTRNYFYECKTKEVEGQTVYYWDITEPTIKPITNAQIDAWWNGGN